MYPTSTEFFHNSSEFGDGYYGNAELALQWI